jgi:XTP/dITP diphosphohydrolase
VSASGPLLLATRNDHKLREFARLLPGVALEPLPAELDSPEETGSTYAENALIKARAAADATGRVAIADDSGIEAAALDGAPGVRSARYAGERAADGENLAKLREEVPEGTALRYVCVIARVAPGGAEQLFEGTCEGVMAPAGRGTRGFGYDPIFVPDDPSAGGRTMAELADEEKDAISHRGRAARALLAALDG